MPESALVGSRAEAQVESDAFRMAQLNSDRIRIICVLAAVLLIVVLQSARMLVLHAHEDRMHLLLKCGFIIFFVVYELLMFRATARALQQKTELPALIWATDTIIETSLAALGIAALTTQ